MIDDKDRKIQDLEAAIKIQANAWRSLEASEDRELNMLRKQEYEAQLALRQLYSEREMNAILTGEVEKLRSRLGAEAADERAKIVVWLRRHGWLGLENAERSIEAGEHLK